MKRIIELIPIGLRAALMQSLSEQVQYTEHLNIVYAKILGKTLWGECTTGRINRAP